MAEIPPGTVIAGIGASGGLAIGVLHPLRVEVEAAARQAGPPEDEEAGFSAAISRAADDLATIIEGADEDAAEILEFQAVLLEDDDILDPVRERIAAGEAWPTAWGAVMDGEIAQYRDGDDDYMAARADDLTDLKRRVLAAEAGGTAKVDIPDGAILIADDLTPSVFLQHDWSRLAGAATVGGSPTSHVSILARARGVNLVVGLESDPATLPEGAEAILDADAGTLTVAPDAEMLARARQRLVAQDRDAAEAAAIVAEPARTADGVPVAIQINVDAPEILDGLDPAICDGIGLTRTEFLFEGAALPDEDAQCAVYSRIVAWAEGRPVTIRALDAGGDKPIPGVTIDGETNPFLGVRGVRLLLEKPDLFRTQLRALLRAAALGPVRIMIPMVAVPEEMEAVRAEIDKARAELAARGVAAGEVEIGMMVEVPAAALSADRFDADFYSIGTNDLVQYTLAAARDNPAVAKLARHADPAVLALIRATVEAGKRLGRSVSVCGNMASDPASVVLAVEQGVRTLSVAPAMVGAIKLALRRATVGGNG
ncbi:MAG: phosphoenolpyruvate--protein phosphotransferase [Rhodobiaceae bacterium]|nr:phosphoenolpyruvate--protein phosphotransferase [Rhodobiaceae bacterium]